MVKTIHTTPLLKLNTTELIYYALLDCAHFDHKFYREIRRYGINTQSLFINTVDESSIFASPVLLEVKQEDLKTVNFLHEIEKQTPAVVWLASSLTYKDIFHNLQFLLRGKLEDEQDVFCRYYDPRCLETYLKIFQNHELLNQKVEQIVYWAIYDSKMDSYRCLHLNGNGAFV